jgi:transposase
MTVLLTPGQQNEATVFERLLGGGAVKRRGRGRPKQRPHRVVGDKADSSRRIRGLLRHSVFRRGIYRLRNQVARRINRCQQFRRLATRYDKRADHYRAFWVIAFCLLWL